MAAENTPQRGIEAAREKAMGAVTPRSVVLGLLTSAVAIATVIWAEYAQGTIQIGYLQIPPVAVGLLFLVVLLNRLAGWIWPRMRLRPAEIIVIYVMLLFSSMVASRGVGQRLWSTMVSVNYYASPANHWQQLYFPNIKPWLVPWNPEGGIAQSGRPGRSGRRQSYAWPVRRRERGDSCGKSCGSRRPSARP